MSRSLLFIIVIFFLSPHKANSQNSQTVSNNTATAPIDITSTGCTYKWVNSDPSIGLPASGTGNIPSFIAINTGSAPVTATVTATSTSPGFAYIPNFHDTTVSVFNTATNEVIATIPIGAALYGVAVSPDGRMAYVTSLNNNTVSVINAATNTIVSTIAVGNSPIGILVNHDGGLVYVASEYGTISVINTTTNLVSSTISLTAAPYGIAISPDGTLLYVTNLGSGNGPGTVSVINTATSQVVATIPVGAYPGHIAISPDGKFVYVLSILDLNANSSNVSVINTATNKVIATIPIGQSAEDISVSPDGSRIYVTNVGGNGTTGTISAINAGTNSVIATININGLLSGLSFSPDGSKLYVEEDDNSNSVLVINTTTNKVTAAIPVGNDPNSSGNFVTAGIGCSIYPIKFTITINPTDPNTIFIPNTFTPNGDGINDTWNIKSLDAFLNCAVTVYNRYGGKVYSSVGYGVPWDGKYHGSNLPAGTYYYVIDLKNGDKNLSGSLTIIR